MITAIREKIRDNVYNLSQMELEETGMGRVEDKVAKHLLTIEKNLVQKM